jgi:hypothetical protein
LRSICVFCGSSPGNDPGYAPAARSLGQTLAHDGITLVYGGGRVGLMGVVADGILDAGGEAIGVIPKTLLEREIGHPGLSDLRIVGSMHERKALMSELSDAFIALPGGNGTLEEFFEVLTWAQLGEHAKPCALLNVSGYYDPLLAFFDHMVARGFLSEEHRSIVLVDTEPEPLLEKIRRYQPPKTAKWMVKEDT